MKKINDKNKFLTLKTRIPKKFIDTKIQNEVKLHFPIKLSFGKKLKLFFMKFSNLFVCSKQSKKLKKLYDLGSKRLEKDMSFERIIKHLRDMRVYMKHSVLNDELKFQI